jgi:hypothetical protein
VGHANDEVNDAVIKQLQKGASFGAPCELEVGIKQLTGKSISADIIETVAGTCCSNLVLIESPCYHVFLSALDWPRVRPTGQ